jgi:hypothetical protein
MNNVKKGLLIGYAPKEKIVLNNNNFYVNFIKTTNKQMINLKLDLILVLYLEWMT